MTPAERAAEDQRRLAAIRLVWLCELQAIQNRRALRGWRVIR